jgi:hypothetical protein
MANEIYALTSYLEAGCDAFDEIIDIAMKLCKCSDACSSMRESMFPDVVVDRNGLQYLCCQTIIGKEFYDSLMATDMPDGVHFIAERILERSAADEKNAKLLNRLNVVKMKDKRPSLSICKSIKNGKIVSVQES